jgi:hypothetical protein
MEKTYAWVLVFLVAFFWRFTSRKNFLLFEKPFINAMFEDLTTAPLSLFSKLCLRKDQRSISTSKANVRAVLKRFQAMFLVVLRDTSSAFVP